MFAPDADIAPYDHPEPETDVVNDFKEINYASTRLEEHTVGDAAPVSAPPSPTRSRIDAAITGTPCGSKMPALLRSLITYSMSRSPQTEG